MNKLYALVFIVLTLFTGVASAKSLIEAETGFTETNIREMREKIQGTGIDPVNTDIIILNLANSLDDLVTFKYGSVIYRTLMNSKGGVEFANDLIAIMENGRKIGAVNELVRTFAKQESRASKVYIARLFNVPIGVMEGLAQLSLEKQRAENNQVEDQSGPSNAEARRLLNYREYMRELGKPR